LRVMCSIFVDASAGTLSCRLLDVVERLIGLDGTMRGVRLGRLAYKSPDEGRAHATVGAITGTHDCRTAREGLQPSLGQLG
jgi:hypothetical protein